MTRQLVEFPDAGDEWEEVDGVGLSILAALPRDEMDSVGQVLADAAILRPASGLMLPGSQFWSSRETLEDDEKLLEQADVIFGKNVTRPKATTARTRIAKVATSVAMDACVRLGVLDKALRSKETGEFWRAGQDDLTPSGFLTLNQLHIAFRRAPLILTFIGDERLAQ